MDCDLCLLSGSSVKAPHRCGTCDKRLCKPCVLSILASDATTNFALTDALDDILRRRQDFLWRMTEQLCQRAAKCPFCGSGLVVRPETFANWVAKRFDVPSLQPLNMLTWCLAQNQNWYIFGFTIMAKLDQRRIARLSKRVKRLRQRAHILNYTRKRLQRLVSQSLQPPVQ